MSSLLSAQITTSGPNVFIPNLLLVTHLSYDLPNKNETKPVLRNDFIAGRPYPKSLSGAAMPGRILLSLSFRGFFPKLFQLRAIFRGSLHDV